MKSNFVKYATVTCIVSVVMQIMFNGMLYYPELNILSFKQTYLLGILAGFSFAVNSYYFGTFLKSKNWNLIGNLTFIIGGLYLTNQILSYFLISNHSLFGLFALLYITQLIFMVIYPLSILALRSELTFHLKRYGTVYLLVISLHVVTIILPYFVPIVIEFLGGVVLLGGILSGLLIIPVYKENNEDEASYSEDILDL